MSAHSVVQAMVQPCTFFNMCGVTGGRNARKEIVRNEKGEATKCRNGELSEKGVVVLGRHQIISRIVFSKRFAHVFDLMRQKPGSETDGIFRLVVNDTSS